VPDSEYDQECLSAYATLPSFCGSPESVELDRTHKARTSSENVTAESPPSIRRAASIDRTPMRIKHAASTDDQEENPEIKSAWERRCDNLYHR
jgi:hypothetical protein